MKAVLLRYSSMLVARSHEHQTLSSALQAPQRPALAQDAKHHNPFKQSLDSERGETCATVGYRQAKLEPKLKHAQACTIEGIVFRPPEKASSYATGKLMSPARQFSTAN